MMQVGIDPPMEVALISSVHVLVVEDLALLGIDDLGKVAVDSGLARTGTRAELVRRNRKTSRSGSSSTNGKANELSCHTDDLSGTSSASTTSCHTAQISPGCCCANQIVEGLVTVIKAMAEEMSAIKELMATNADKSLLLEEIARLREEVREVRTVQQSSKSSRSTNSTGTFVGSTPYASVAAYANVLSSNSNGSSSTSTPIVPTVPTAHHASMIPVAMTTDTLLNVDHHVPPASTTTVMEAPSNSSTDGDGWSIVESRNIRKQNATSSSKFNRTISSIYTRPEQVHPSADTLQGADRIRGTAIYLGNVDAGCKTDFIASWGASKDVEVLSCSLSESRYLGTAFARVVVRKSNEEAMLSDTFWPSKIYARLWRFNFDDKRLDIEH